MSKSILAQTVFQNTNNLYFTKCTKNWAIYFFQWKKWTKKTKSKEKKN